MTRSRLHPERLGSLGRFVRSAGSVAADRGFTLIEVLVALAVVAITLAAGIQASGALTRNAARVAEVTEAQFCAENQLTSWRLLRQQPDIGEADFSCDELGHSYAGKLTVRSTPNPNFRRLQTTIQNDRGEPVLSLSTVLSRYPP